VSHCTSIHHTVSHPADAATADALRTRLESVDTQFAEIWIDHNAFPALCALINGDLGWLMLIRFDGDAGFSSRNPSYTGPANLEREYRIGNGQLDRYPASWAYPKSVVLDALLHFTRTKLVPDSIIWFNDSGDGSPSPNTAAQPSLEADDG
jgi:hypothetical protein